MTPVTEVNPPGIVLQFFSHKNVNLNSSSPCFEVLLHSNFFSDLRWFKVTFYTRDDIQKGIAPSPCFLSTAIQCSALRYYRKRLFLGSFRPFKNRFENKLPMS